MTDKLILAAANVLLYARHPRAVFTLWRRIKHLPNVADPRDYLERTVWRKLVDHNPLFVELTDKLRAKEYCRRICPEMPLPRTLWVGDNADDIPDHLLTGADVIVKTNHGFAQNYRIRGGAVDRRDLKRKTDEWMRQVHGEMSNQWAYAHVQPALFVEEAVGDAAQDLLEFCIHATNGQPIRGLLIGHNKLPEKWMVPLDLEGRPTRGATAKPDSPITPLPEGLDISQPYETALAYTRTLSESVDYARFDYMWNGTTLYGGEITIYPGGMRGGLINPVVEEKTLAMWDLRATHFLTADHKGLLGVYSRALRRTLDARAGSPYRASVHGSSARDLGVSVNVESGAR